MKNKIINCQRCGKPTLLSRPNKRYCSEYCRKREEKKRYYYRYKKRRK